MMLALEASGDRAARHSEYPGGERRLAAVAVDRVEDVDEDFLNGLLGVGGIAEAFVDEQVDALEEALIDFPEGDFIALGDPNDQRFV